MEKRMLKGKYVFKNNLRTDFAKNRLIFHSIINEMGKNVLT